MPRSSTRCRPPQAGRPILCSDDAIAVVSLAIHRPLEFETIAFFLDDEARSNKITIVTGTVDPDSVLEVAETLSLAAETSPALCGLVLATVRPNADRVHTAILPGDIDRWTEASTITDAHGIELIEWFVIGPNGVACPREVLGDPERW